MAAALHGYLLLLFRCWTTEEIDARRLCTKIGTCRRLSCLHFETAVKPWANSQKKQDDRQLGAPHIWVLLTFYIHANFTRCIFDSDWFSYSHGVQESTPSIAMTLNQWYHVRTC